MCPPTSSPVQGWPCIARPLSTPAPPPPSPSLPPSLAPWLSAPFWNLFPLIWRRDFRLNISTWNDLKYFIRHLVSHSEYFPSRNSFPPCPSLSLSLSLPLSLSLSREPTLVKKIFCENYDLKGLSNKIFDLQFFSYSNSNLPGPLTNGLTYFRFWSRIRRVVRALV